MTGSAACAGPCRRCAAPPRRTRPASGGRRRSRWTIARSSGSHPVGQAHDARDHLVSEALDCPPRVVGKRLRQQREVAEARPDRAGDSLRDVVRRPYPRKLRTYSSGIRWPEASDSSSFFCALISFNSGVIASPTRRGSGVRVAGHDHHRDDRANGVWPFDVVVDRHVDAREQRKSAGAAGLPIPRSTSARAWPRPSALANGATIAPSVTAPTGSACRRHARRAGPGCGA